MARFYKLSVGRSLFGDIAVVREWGRIGTIGRMRIDLFANENEALVALDAIERAKTRRGYREIGGAVCDGCGVDPTSQEKRRAATDCSVAGPSYGARA